MKPTPILATDVSWLVERNLSILGQRLEGDDLIRAVADLVLRQHFQYAALHKAKRFIAVMDGGDNFRFDVYPLYKHRRATYTDERGRVLSTDEVKAMLESGALNTATRERSITHDCRDAFKALCQELSIPVFHAKRFEGDDGLASMASWAERYSAANPKDPVKVFMVTPDKDCVQAVNQHAVQWRPGTGSGKNAQPALLVDMETLGTRLAKIVSTKAVGWTPDQYLDWQTLHGDDGDDIPRLLTPGEATKAICAHGSLPKYHKAMIKETRAAGKPPLFSEDEVRRNIQLVTLKRDLISDECKPDDFLVPVNSRTKLSKGLHHFTGTAIGDWVSLPPPAAKLGLFNR